MKLKISIIAVFVLSLIFSTVTFARSYGGMDFTLRNRTGYDIAAVYISPSTRNHWERYYSPYGNIIYDGESTDLYIEIRRDVRYFDIRCTYTNGRSEVFYGEDIYSGHVTLGNRHRRHNRHDDDEELF